jgi:hypothetical protein
LLGVYYESLGGRSGGTGGNPGSRSVASFLEKLLADHLRKAGGFLKK